MKKALITVYQPAEGVRNNILAVARQVDEVYICDNSSQSNEELLDIAAVSNLKYFYFGENLGLSSAFNRVLKTDEFADNDYVIFFDQDSFIEDGHIDALIGEYDALKSSGAEVGCLGPVFFNTSSGIVEAPRIKTQIGKNSFKVSSIITSSMICKYGDIKKIGFWNERVFLDMADWDFSWRMVKAGMICCMTDIVTLKHSLGTGEKHIGPLRVREGSPFREYYQTRECLYLLTRSYTPFKYRIRFIAMLTIRPIMHLLFLSRKTERLKYIFKGIKDFFAKKTGALKQ